MHLYIGWRFEQYASQVSVGPCSLVLFISCSSPSSLSSAGVAKLLLEFGANINTHSNEFKESALTLACYKGHLEMVKFLLSAGKCTCIPTHVYCTTHMYACSPSLCGQFW